MNDLSGRRFGNYLLQRMIGQGGMGQVYLAHDEGLNRPVAVKVLLDDSDPEFRERFLREAPLAAKLEEQHIVPVHWAGEIDGTLLMVMRYIDGPSLADLIHGGRLTFEQLATILAGVGSALDAAHRAGLVHRDVKPSNILVTGAAHPYLTDFGIAQDMTAPARRLTGTGLVVGSAPYMAPERMSGADGGPASDTYSLAVVAFEALTGSVPFDGSPAALVLAATTADRPDARKLNPKVPAAAADVIRRGMALRPVDRPRTSGEFAQQLGAALTARQAPTRREDIHTVPTGALTAAESLGDERMGDEQAAGRSRRGGGRKRLAGAAIVAALLIGGGAYARSQHGENAGASGSTSSAGSTSSRAGAAVVGSAPGVGSGSGDNSSSGSGGSAATCVTATGASTDCTSSGAGRVVTTSSCTTSDALAALGVDAQLQVLVDAKRAGSRCAVFPNSIATAAGASAQDLASLTSDPPADLLACAPDAEHGGTTISCSAPHRIEFISGWEKESTQPDCSGLAATYTRRTIGGTSDVLSVGSFSGRMSGITMTRCYVSSSENLDGSLWRIGGSSLPTS